MKGTILVVDDDADLVQALSIRLNAADFDVLTAFDSVSAVMLAQRERPDLILLDIGLPAGDGYSVMKRLLRIPRMARTPVIIMSARDAVEHRPRSLQAGAHSYLQKPVDSHDLMRAIGEALQPSEG